MSHHVNVTSRHVNVTSCHIMSMFRHVNVQRSYHVILTLYNLSSHYVLVMSSHCRIASQIDNLSYLALQEDAQVDAVPLPAVPLAPATSLVTLRLLSIIILVLTLHSVCKTQNGGKGIINFDVLLSQTR